MSSIGMIRRSTSDYKLAGLCGGVAREWGVDPVLVRVGWALLALSGGLGVVLYLAGWLLLPVEGKDTAPVDDLFGESVRRWPREVWIALIIVACVAGFALFGWLTPFSIGPALVIAVIWYFGFYRPRSARRTSPPPSAALPTAPPAAPFRYPGPPTPFTQAAEAWQRRVSEYQAQAAGLPPGPSWSPPPSGTLAPPVWPAPAAYASGPVRTEQVVDPEPVVDPEQVERAAFLATPDPAGLYTEPAEPPAGPQVRPGQRLAARRLRWAALLVLGLAMSGLGLADYLGADITPPVYAATALLVAGIALVLATWFGRARGLLPVGVLLAVTVLGFSAGTAGVPGVPSGLPVNTRVYDDVAQFPTDGDALDAGTLRVDLTRLRLTEDATYEAHVDLGTVVINPPPDADVEVRYSVDVGSVTIFDKPMGHGPDLNGMTSDTRPATRPGAPKLTLDLSVDVGAVQVTR